MCSSTPCTEFSVIFHTVIAVIFLAVIFHTVIAVVSYLFWQPGCRDQMWFPWQHQKWIVSYLFWQPVCRDLKYQKILVGLNTNIFSAVRALRLLSQNLQSSSTQLPLASSTQLSLSFPICSDNQYAEIKCGSPDNTKNGSFGWVTEMYV
jgi:hypothetical protein